LNENTRNADRTLIHQALGSAAGKRVHHTAEAARIVGRPIGDGDSTADALRDVLAGVELLNSATYQRRWGAQQVEPLN